jgi:hypothetical protein
MNMMPVPLAAAPDARRHRFVAIIGLSALSLIESIGSKDSDFH